MAKDTQTSSSKILSFKNPESRLSKAAVDYVDALMTVQRTRFERELLSQSSGVEAVQITRPKSAQILAESDDFIGAGWTNLGNLKDGTAFRWMGRIGSLMLPIDLSEHRPFVIRGCGFTKRRFLKETTLWIEDQQLDFTLSRRGFNQWLYKGVIPAMPQRPYYLLRLQSPGLAPLIEGLDTRVSLAVSEISINC